MNDPHTETASRLFGVTPGSVTGEMRRVARAINYMELYGTRLPARVVTGSIKLNESSVKLLPKRVSQP